MRPTTRAGMCVMALLVVVAFHAIYPIYQVAYLGEPKPDMSWVADIDGLYEATATILAIVGFGSPIGVKLSTNRERAGLQRGGLTLVFGCSAVVIIIQVLVMLGVCCFGLHMFTYAMYLALTGISLMVIIVGYVVVANEQGREVRKRKTRSRSLKFVAKTATDEQARDQDK